MKKQYSEEQKQSIRKCLNALDLIDIAVDIIDANDVYGDLGENFKELDKQTLITERLREMLKEDLA